MPQYSGGEAIVLSLIAHDVGTVFGLPGVQNDHLYNAFFDYRDRIQVIHTRHEQATAYMALGYALTSDRAGVYCVVPGPGFLNTTAALATAYGRNARVLCISGQIRLDQIGRGFGLLHEIPDQLSIMRGLTKWAARIEHPTAAPQLVGQAFYEMAMGRPRPVALECPMDVLSARTEVDLSVPDFPVRHPSVDPDAIAQAARLLREASSPLIIVGGGAFAAREAIQAVGEVLQAPVVASYNAQGVLSSNHPLSLTLPMAYELWPRTDLVLAIGTRLQVPLLDWGRQPGQKLIRIDVDPAEQRRISPSDVAIVARGQDAAPLLLSALEQEIQPRPSRKEELDALRARWEDRIGRLRPQIDYVRLIREELPDDGFFVEDMTQIGYVARYSMPVYHPHTYVSTGYQGTLGWGFATALGVQVANPDRAVLAVTGDGGFLFNVQELSTAVQNQLNVVTLVFNDGAYGNVRRMQIELHDERVIASDLNNPDFVALAEAFGAQGLRATTMQELRLAIRRGLDTAGPTVIDIPVGAMPNPRPFLYPDRDQRTRR